MTLEKEQHLSALQAKFESYTPITKASLLLIASISQFQTLQKGEILLQEGQLATQFHFICKGAIQGYITDKEGNIYNKNLFLEGDLCASSVSLLSGSPSFFTLEAMEDVTIINVNHKKYRTFLDKHHDLKRFYIAYLARNWFLEKAPRAVSLVIENPKERYVSLLHKHPNLHKRISQLHIAAHLGITPRQLSSIRKELKVDS